MKKGKKRKDLSSGLDGSLRPQKQARPAHGGPHLAKPRIRSVINSLTFIVIRTIRYKGKENEVFTRIIRTPFGVLLPFVPTKQKSLHYLSFRQIVAQQEGNLTSTEAERSHAVINIKTAKYMS